MIRIDKPTINDIEILKKCAEAYPDIVSTVELNKAIKDFKEINLNCDQLMTKGKGYKIVCSKEQGKLGKKGRCKEE